MRIVLRPGALNAFGPVIKRLRESSRQKLTQADVAARITNLGLPMDRSILSRIENQKRGLSDIELIYISKALRTSLVRICELADLNRSDPMLYPTNFEPDEDLDIQVAEVDPADEPF